MLHTINGFICAAVGFSLVDILNQNAKFKFQLSPFFLAVVAFCFSMTIGVLWEFFEFGMDIFFNMDMQKDTIINEINSVVLTPDGSIGQIYDINNVIINGNDLGLNGYLDIGLFDTMKDLLVNFIVGLILMIFIKEDLSYGIVIFSIFLGNNIVFTKSRLSKNFWLRSLQYILSFIFTVLIMFINLLLFNI